MKIKKQKGFSLLELIIAIFIFSLVMLAAVVVFSKMMESYKASRNMQKNLENAQFALNLMAKYVRESKIISSSQESQITILNRGTNCIRYRFNSTNRTLEVGSVSSSSCSGIDTATFSTAVNYVNGVDFFVTQTNTTTSPYQVGHVTILMKLCADSACSQKGQVNLQTSVSLRNISS